MSTILVGGMLWAAMACQAGQRYDLCRTMVAVTQVESSGCKNLIGDDGKSLGCDQISLPAARAVGYHVTRRQLLRNTPLNMRIGAAYMARCIARMGTWERGVVAYNMGEKIAVRLSWSQIERSPYLRKIKAAMPPPMPPQTTLELTAWQVEAPPYKIAQRGLSGGAGGLLTLKLPPIGLHSQKQQEQQEPD